MITCKYDIQRASHWKECGQPAVELKITSSTGEGFDYELCLEHLDALCAAGLVEAVRTLLASTNEASPGVSEKVAIREDSYGGHVEGVIKWFPL